MTVTVHVNFQMFLQLKHNKFVILSLIINYSHGESNFIIFLEHIVFSFIYQSKSKLICAYPQ